MHTVEQLDILLVRKLHHIVQLLNVYYHHGSETWAQQEKEGETDIHNDEAWCQRLLVHVVHAEKYLNQQVHCQENKRDWLVAVEAEEVNYW